MTSKRISRFIIQYIYVILLFSFSNTLTSQVKSIGLPEVNHYTTEETLAGAQTWDIIEDVNGNVYFGNENGILKYDGEDWDLIHLENNSEVHALALGSDGKIYVGGYTEIGVIETDSTGKSVYKSLNHLLPEQYNNFSVVWKIYQTRYGILFQSYEYLFIKNGDTFSVIEPENSFGLSYYINNSFYIIEKGSGLKVLSGGRLQTVSNAPIFSGDEIRLILPYKSNDLLIGSFSKGLFVLNENGLDKWNVELNRYVIDNNLYNGSVSGGNYIFGTVKNGVYIADRDGNIIQHLNRSKGLQNNTVLSHFNDSRGNLWLGLDNGIDYLKISLPITFLNHNFNIEAVYSSLVYRNKLYVGTNQGLFMKPMDELSDPMDIEFEMVENSEGQVWSLMIVDDQLLCGHNYGAFRIEDNRAIKISGTDGVWNFFQLNDVDDYLFSGSYYGLVVYKKDHQGFWQQADTINLNKSLRRIICDNENNIWISHDYEGLYKVRLNDELDALASIDHFLDTAGLGGNLPYSIHLFENEFFVSTTLGNFTYDSTKNEFVPSDELNTFFKGLGKISFLKVDSRGNLWYTAEQNTGLFRLLEDGTYINIFTPFKQIRSLLKEGYENIFIYDNRNIFIGSLHGLIHYDPTIVKNFLAPISTYIKKVTIHSNRRDSVLSYMGNKGTDTNLAYLHNNLDFDWNTISFTYHCPDPENAENIMYSYKLSGESDVWSEWTSSDTKEFNNLSDGDYIFEVRAKNIYNNISASDLYAFSIDPPFYRSVFAYIIYILLLLFMLLTGSFYLKRRFEHIRSTEEEKHAAAFQKKEERLKEEQLRAEREIERLEIEKLEASMKYKNKELANSTYHIIRKNKFLNSLKQELSKLSNEAKSDFVETELKKISKKIDKDISNEKNWAVFDRYFDEVHQKFLERLKEKHPGLSPKELRLSAYLRMNISTKEIAPLMNISIRGVEISRYRLRKKLDLERDDNLTQYLMDI